MQTVMFNAVEKLDFRTKESYKTLRTNLEFSGKERKVISVTSCTPNEGKTSVSFQLALSIAEGGKKVLLIDADLRKSVLKGRYKTNSSRYGLSHYLSGQSTITDVICKTNIENFYVIFTGPVPPNPSELLGGAPFEMLLRYLRGEFDYVIVDTPPLGSVIDGAIAAQQCDGAVIVVESGAISYKFAQRVKEQLDKVDCKTLGVILNKVNMSGKGYYGAYYGKHYGKYYGKYYGHDDGEGHSGSGKKGGDGYAASDAPGKMTAKDKGRGRGKEEAGRVHAAGQERSGGRETAGESVGEKERTGDRENLAVKSHGTEEKRNEYEELGDFDMVQLDEDSGIAGK